MHEMKSSLVVALAYLAFCACTIHKGTLLLVNKAREPIARALVEVCGQIPELKNVQVNQSASVSYVVTCEGDYLINIEFKSGRRLQTKTGYITTGFDFQDEILVTDADIEMKGIRVGNIPVKN
jgi:hypothetical protein